MSRLKILLTCLAIVGSAGIVNCSKMKGNRGAGAGKDLSTEQVTEDEQKKLEAIDVRDALLVDLTKMVEAKFSEDYCNAESLEALAKSPFVLPKENNDEIFPMDVIKDPESSADAIKLAAMQLGQILAKASNKHCGVNVAADVAKFAIDNFIIQGDAVDEVTIEEFITFNTKAQQIVEQIKPIQDQLLLEIETYNGLVKKRTDLSNKIKSLIVLNQSRIETNASLNPCVVGDTCTDLGRRVQYTGIYAQTDIVEAQAALTENALSGNPDKEIEDKVTRLMAVESKLTKRYYSLVKRTRLLENQNGYADNSEIAEELAQGLEAQKQKIGEIEIERFNRAGENAETQEEALAKDQATSIETEKFNRAQQSVQNQAKAMYQCRQDAISNCIKNIEIVNEVYSQMHHEVQATACLNLECERAEEILEATQESLEQKRPSTGGLYQ